jgi:predicted MFS family arabinose efflux permease
VVAAYALVGAATQMLWLTFAPVSTVAAQAYGVSVEWIGQLANVFVLVFVLLAVPAGVLLDRNLRLYLFLGAVLAAVGGIVRLGGKFPWLLVGGVVAALGQPLVLTGITGLTRAYLEPRHRPTGIALATASTFAGMVLAFLLGTVLSTADQMSTLVAVDAVFAVVAALTLGWALRAPVVFADQALRVGWRASATAVRRAWAIPMVRVLCLLVFIPFGTFIALTTWTEALLEPAGVTVEQVGVVLVVNVVAGVVGSATLPSWVAKRGWEVHATVVAIVVTVGACLLLALAPGFVTALVGLAVAGFVLLPMLPVVLEIVERSSADLEGVASGLVWSVGNLGGVVIATIVTFTVSSPAASFLLLAAFMVLAAVLLPRLRRLLATVPRVGAQDAPERTVLGE